MVNARDGYEPKPYSGRMLILRLPDSPRGKRMDPALGWTELARGQLDVDDVRRNRILNARDDQLPFAADVIAPLLHALDDEYRRTEPLVDRP